MRVYISLLLFLCSSILAASDITIVKDKKVLQQIQVEHWPVIRRGASLPYALNGKIGVQFKKTVTSENIASTFTDLQLEIVEEQVENPYFYLVTTTPDRDLLSISQLLEKRDIVRWASPDMLVPVALHRKDPNDVLYNYEGGVLSHLKNQVWDEATETLVDNENHNIPSAWDITTGNSNISVAVIDTGIDMNHPDLKDNIIAGYDVLNSTGNGSPVIDQDKNSEFMDYHGTAVAGIIGAVTNNQIGTAGICWECGLISGRLIDKDGTIYDYVSRSKIKEAIDKAVELGADVINNSWGPFIRNQENECYKVDFNEFIAQGIADAVANGRKGRGAVVVFSVGNNACSTDFLPHLNNSNILRVAALDGLGNYPEYANYGDYVDISALEGNWSTDISGADGASDGTDTFLNKIEGLDAANYIRNFRGTSAAAPVISGAVALMLSVNPNLTALEAIECVKNAAETFDTACPHGDWTEKGEKSHSPCFGYGKLMADKLITMAMDGSCGGMCSESSDCVDGTVCNIDTSLCYFGEAEQQDEMLSDIDIIETDDTDEDIDITAAVDSDSVEESIDNVEQQQTIDEDRSDSNDIEDDGCSCSIIFQE